MDIDFNDLEFQIALMQYLKANMPQQQEAARFERPHPNPGAAERSQVSEHFNTDPVDRRPPEQQIKNAYLKYLLGEAGPRQSVNYPNLPPGSFGFVDPRTNKAVALPR